MANLPSKGQSTSMDNVAVTREQFRTAMGSLLEYLAGALGNVTGTYTTATVDPTNVRLRGAPQLTSDAVPSSSDDSNRIPSTAWVRTYVGSASSTTPDATESVKGKIQIASQTEVTTGTDTLKAVTPAYLATTYMPKSGGTFSGTVTSSSTVSDSKGNLRSIPQNAQTSAYTLQAADAGKHISTTTGGITIPASIFSVGDPVTVFNNSATSQTITTTAVTAYFPGQSTAKASFTLATRGICTILCVGSNTFVISGAGLS
jgi:hypothetical protein